MNGSATAENPVTEDRVRLLKRLREKLLTQREKFHNYLQLLEAEQQVIQRGDIEKLELQAQTEKMIIDEIFTLQKVIRPLEEIYRHLYPNGNRSIAELEASLENMRRKVLDKNERNRLLLKEKMSAIRQEIRSLRRNFRYNSVRSMTGTPTLVDIST
jgi:hypothetical protein